MNVKITTEQSQRLDQCVKHKLLFGSRLFGTHTEESDYDYICIYDFEEVFNLSEKYVLTYPNTHCFQYDDTPKNEQRIYMTQTQFYRNLFQGDGTMQSDIFIYGNDPLFESLNKLEIIRTYKVIKAYLGVARRDLTLNNTQKKLWHANRGLATARCLMNNELPTKEYIQWVSKNLQPRDVVLKECEALRKQAHEMYQKDILKNYYIDNAEGDDLLHILLDSNNLKQFKY